MNDEVEKYADFSIEDLKAFALKSCMDIAKEVSYSQLIQYEYGPTVQSAWAIGKALELKYKKESK